MAFALVSAPIASYGFFPAGPARTDRKECQVPRFPVALHKALEVVPVPGIDLAIKDGANLWDRVLAMPPLLGDGVGNSKSGKRRQ